MSEKEFIDLANPVYGQPIALENGKNDNGKHVMGAHSMISQFLNVRANYRADLKDLTEGDTHAERYFCSDDIAYIFNIDIMRSIIAAIDKDKRSNKKGCVVFFQGVKKTPLDDNALPKGFAFGRPTLIATAYIQESNGDLVNIKVPYIGWKKEVEEAFEAFEHPGDGTGGTTKSLEAKDQSIVIHRNCEKDDDLCDTDFGINKTIKKEDLLKWHH